MIYPKSFEQKIGFVEVRTLLRERCLSALGKERVEALSFSTDVAAVNEWLCQVREFRRLQEEAEDFPLQHFLDVREAVARLRPEGTHMEESELFDLRRSLETIHNIVIYLNRTAEDDDYAAPRHKDNDYTTTKREDNSHTSAKHEDNSHTAARQTANEATAISDAAARQTANDAAVISDAAPDNRRWPYPSLRRLTEGVVTFPLLVRGVDRLLDKFGRMKDTASPTLQAIRSELARTEGSISKTLHGILRAAQSEGLVDKDVTPAVRDGRLVIPVTQGLKRKIRGIVHDESASGKTVYVEPAEVVEANNRIRELEADERREIIRILTDFAREIRPHVDDILHSYRLLAAIDLIRAKAEVAKLLKGTEPTVGNGPYIDWAQATHPLLQLSLMRQGKRAVPLDITLTPGQRILIISGPNAGGKSVCLKTVGLLQYMLQCGLSIPVGENSRAGLFHNIMIDIGDEQSIENDLSTYSSHLANMKQMIRHCNERTLLLIDEFGAGTEPQIGAAIAEAVLRQFCKRSAFGVITTHYQNLKHFADNHPSVVNGAMLYDRQQMSALFQLSIGNPGSSFAIEIARKTGLPEEVIRDASEIVGSDYIQSDKYLQDIVRDKRYWADKRQGIHQHERQMEQTIGRYEAQIAEIEQSRKDILRRAKEQAEELLRESNRKIENAIREIRESQAEKAAAKRVREELEAFKEEVKEIDTTANDEFIAKKIRQIQERKARKEKRKAEKAVNDQKAADALKAAKQKATGDDRALAVGDTVCIKGTTAPGTLESIDGKEATVIFGGMRTRMSLDRLTRSTHKPSAAAKHQQLLQTAYHSAAQGTRAAIDSRKQHFRQDLDVRGLRGDEALTEVTRFLDDAILVGESRVRILHGTGTGALRQLIRQYLATVPNVSAYRDEHVQFGGAGITVVDID